VPILPGDPGVPFKARTHQNATYVFDVAAGRYLVLCFLPSSDEAYARFLRDTLQPIRGLFDDVKTAFFGVVRTEALAARVEDSLPGVRWFLDVDRAVSRAYGLEGPAGEEGAGWIVLDPSFRILMTAPLEHSDKLVAALAALPPVELHAGTDVHAPVLVLPRVFDQRFCRRLVEAYLEGEPEASGFMRESDGKTVGATDPSHKIRSDVSLADPLRHEARSLVLRRLVPQVQKAFSFRVTRQERDIVACYDGEQGGFFRAHRDNTTRGTAHRRFAVTINLNAEDYEGGDLVFPEFGPRTYRAPTGGAVVFSCSLLHAALPVTRGRRYAYLPFLYDDAAAQEREANMPHVAPELQGYRSGLPS
jgi:predicted 2-oxoglutarate/Fe(II)-dependent dioxygenase YbiX